jgi:hypothetical protein
MRRTDALALRRGNGSTKAAHLATGERDKWEALFLSAEAGIYRRGKEMEECEVGGRCRLDRLGWEVAVFLLK